MTSHFKGGGMSNRRKISGLFSDFKKVEHVAFDNQIKFVDSVYDQFTRNGDLSENQVAVLKKIVCQCEEHIEERSSYPACVPH